MPIKPPMAIIWICRLPLLCDNRIHESLASVFWRCVYRPPTFCECIIRPVYLSMMNAAELQGKRLPSAIVMRMRSWHHSAVYWYTAAVK